MGLYGVHPSALVFISSIRGISYLLSFKRGYITDTIVRV